MNKTEIVKRKPGQPTVVTEQKKQGIIAAMREGMPMRYACDLVGLSTTVVYNAAKREPEFYGAIKGAKAFAIKQLIQATNKQGGAWKLLKNVGKEEFKERVEVEENRNFRLMIDTGDGEEETFDV